MIGKRKDRASDAARKSGSGHRSAGAVKTLPKRRNNTAEKTSLAQRQNGKRDIASISPTMDTSDDALFRLLDRVKAADDLAQVRELSDQIERLVFHKQFENAQDPEAATARNHGSPARPLPHGPDLAGRFRRTKALAGMRPGGAERDVVQKVRKIHAGWRGGTGEGFSGAGDGT
jgi:hypothetical protein